MSELAGAQVREWCLVKVDPVNAGAVLQRLEDLGIFAIAPTFEQPQRPLDEPDDTGVPVLNDVLFVEYNEGLLAQLDRIEGVVSTVLSNAGRVQDIPQSIVDALVAPDLTAREDATLSQLKSRLMALSEFYRLEYLLSEVARLQAAPKQTRAGRMS